MCVGVRGRARGGMCARGCMRKRVGPFAGEKLREGFKARLCIGPCKVDGVVVGCHYEREDVCV